MYLEKSALKYQHELNSQNLQNHKAMDFEIRGFFLLAAGVFYMLQNKTNILGKITGFDVFFSKWASLDVPQVSENWNESKIK